MGRFVARRILYMFAVILVVSAITFGLMHAVPGGPFEREKPLPPEIIANLEKRYHLDEPLLMQYGRYLYEIFIPRIDSNRPGLSLENDFLINIRLGESTWFHWMNFGPSYSSRSRTVNDIFRDNLPVSFQLGIMALTVAILLGVPLGIIAALKQNTIFDYFRAAMMPSGWGSKPPYVMGVFPSTMGWDYWKHAIMPAVALGLGSSAIIARLTRASLLQVVREDYIRTARAKGLKERLVLTRHALKNSLIPVVTVLGPMFAALVTGTFVTETTFGIPGMGRYFVTSITNRDYPVIMGTILLYAVFLVVANLIVDLLYAFLDPRIRYE